jgi:hypothetical protein
LTKKSFMKFTPGDSPGPEIVEKVGDIMNSKFSWLWQICQQHFKAKTIKINFKVIFRNEIN